MIQLKVQHTVLVLFFFCYLPFNVLADSYTYDGTLTQDDIDQSVLHGSPGNINQMDEGKVYMDQIIKRDEYEATTGCVNEGNRRFWGGDETWNTQGCASTGNSTHEDLGTGTITFGYNTTIVSQTQNAIADALKIAGITVVGYRWQWKVKNADVNKWRQQAQTSPDPLYIRVITKDTTGKVLHEKEWDYSQYILNWQLKSGMEWYDPFIMGEKIDTITLEIEGKDAGYWQGYYGPEAKSGAIYSILVVDPSTYATQDLSLIHI